MRLCRQKYPRGTTGPGARPGPVRRNDHGPDGCLTGRVPGSGATEPEGNLIMANLNVTYADMEQAASQLKAGHQAMHAELQRLYKICEHLTSSTYVTDRSSGAFMTSYTQFNTGATQMMQGLEGMAKFL